MKSIETERLYLRPFTKNDIEIQELVFGDPEICKFYCRNTRTLEETQEWLIYRAWQARLDEVGFWAVTLKDDGKLLGLVAIQQYIASWVMRENDRDYPYSRLEVEYSYALGKRYWGNGYVTEAGRASIDYAFGEVRLERIVNCVDKENERSVNVLRRLGFTIERNLHPEGENSVLGILNNTSFKSPLLRPAREIVTNSAALIKP